MLTINDIDRYQPIYIEGKRPKNRPYLDVQTLDIISRREHIKRTSGETPEQKAVRRYREGKAPAGKTVKKHLKKEEKRKKKEETGGYVSTEAGIPTRHQPHGDIDRGMVQLAGTYRYADMETGEVVMAGGFSRAYPHRNLYVQRPEAVRFGIKRLREEAGGGSSRFEWLGPKKGIVEEVWLRF